MTYEECVIAGKQLIESVQDRQIKICEYAIKACTIRHGGRSDKFYTMKDYATDIGINNKTLNQWMLVYRNVLMKLSDKQLKETTWQQAAKTNENLEQIVTIKNKIDGTTRKKGNHGTIAKEKVQHLHEELINEKPFISEFLGIVKSSGYAKHLLSKRDLSIIDQRQLLHLMEILDECSDMINDYLTNLKSKSA